MIYVYDPNESKKQPPVPLTLAINGNDHEVWIIAVNPHTGKMLCNLAYISKYGIKIPPHSRSELESADVDTSAVAWDKDGSIMVVKN